MKFPVTYQPPLHDYPCWDLQELWNFNISLDKRTALIQDCGRESAQNVQEIQYLWCNTYISV